MFRDKGDRRSFSLTRDTTVVGRREDADFRIPLSDISRKHCRIIKDGELLTIEDLGSANGTFVNGKRIHDAELSPGDTLQIGPTQFLVQIDGVPNDDELPGHNTMMGRAVGLGTALQADDRSPPSDLPPLPPAYRASSDSITIDEKPGESNLAYEDLDEIVEDPGELVELGADAAAAPAMPATRPRPTAPTETLAELDAANNGAPSPRENLPPAGTEEPIDQPAPAAAAAVADDDIVDDIVFVDDTNTESAAHDDIIIDMGELEQK